MARYYVIGYNIFSMHQNKPTKKERKENISFLLENENESWFISKEN